MPPAVYFDSAAAAPLHPVARQALQAALADGWADPAKVYAPGRRSRQLLDAAREAVGEVVGARPDEVWFTGGGTAAVSAAVRGAAHGGAVAHSAVEHSAVMHAVAAAEADGVPVPVDRLGRLRLDRWGEAVTAPGVRLAALISASHEVGTVQPVAEAAEACRRARVPLLVDAGQSLGRAPVPDGWSLLAGSARKWGGPTGVGVLVVRRGTAWRTPYPRDDGLPVAGPEALDVPSVVAAAAALRAAAAEAEQEDTRLRPLTDRIRATVAATVPDVEVLGDPVHRLPHLVAFSCLYVDGEALLHALNRRGFAVSSGSSCTSSTLRPSHVLEAMGVLSHGNVRLSLHRETTAAQVDRFLAELPEVVAQLRAEVGMVDGPGTGAADGGGR